MIVSNRFIRKSKKVTLYKILKNNSLFDDVIGREKSHSYGDYTHNFFIINDCDMVIIVENISRKLLIISTKKHKDKIEKSNKKDHKDYEDYFLKKINSWFKSEFRGGIKIDSSKLEIKPSIFKKHLRLNNKYCKELDKNLYEVVL